MLNRHAENYRALVTGAGESPIGIFGRRIGIWEASPTHSLALRIANSALPPDEQTEIFRSIESYLVRRAICGLTRKNYNKVFAQLLRKAQTSDLSAASFRALLSDGAGEISRWPRDEEFRSHWINGDIYPGRLTASMLRAIFHRLETAMRSEKSEERVPLALDDLDIDHILPQSWNTYWPLSDGTVASADEISQAHILQFAPESMDAHSKLILEREKAVPRIGNLTLVHYGVNRSLQNHAYPQKRAALFEHSNLQLNRKLMQLDGWDESAIAKRGETLFETARGLWIGPSTT
nr:HNH endonuclease family protein [Paraburkholderia sacchari]